LEDNSEYVVLPCDFAKLQPIDESGVPNVCDLPDIGGPPNAPPFFDAVRANWKQGDYIEAFSRENGRWFKAEITFVLSSG